MIVCRVLFAFGGFGMAADPDRSIDLGDGDAMSVWEIAVGLVALVYLPVFIFSVVTFLMWLYRTYTNLPALRSDNVEFTPGWAVGWWFIPFANLIKPYQAVRNVWAESDPEVEVHNTFLSSVQSGAPGYMMFWWGMWLFGNIFSNITSRLDSAALPSERSLIGALGVFESIVWIIAGMLAIKVISDITSRQERRFEVVGQPVFSEPPPPPTFENESI